MTKTYAVMVKNNDTWFIQEITNSKMTARIIEHNLRDFWKDVKIEELI
jgi:hypothetical protein